MSHKQLPPRFIRILVIEDNIERQDSIRSIIPADIRIVFASSAGRAIGILNRDRGNVYSGLMLDHDLQEQSSSDPDPFLCGADVVESIIKNIYPPIPILVHSMNRYQRSQMASALREAGFDVSVTPMDQLTSEGMQDWIQSVRETFENF